VSDAGGGVTFVLEGMSDVGIETLGIGVGVLYDLGFFIFGPLGFFATEGAADWVRVGLHIGVNLEIIDNPLVAESVLSITKMLGSGDHITIELRSEVVISILGWVMPFGLRCISAHFELVAESTFRDLEGVVVVDDVVVNTEVGNWVVDVIASCLLLVLVLAAAS